MIDISKTKGYKKTKLGLIPEDWEIDQLGNNFYLINGKAFKPADWKKSGIPIIRIQNLNDSNASFNYYDGDVEKKYHVTNGDLLFAWSGSIGVSFGARVWKGPDAYLNQHIFKVATKEKIDDSFALHLLLKVQSRIERKAHGFKSSFVHVKKSELEKTLLILPPINEQQRISTILSTWDKAIEKLGQLIEAKEVQKKGLMQRLLTGKIRLPGFEDQWKEVTLGEHLVKHNEKTDISNQYPVLTSSRKGIFLQKNYFSGRNVASTDTTGYNVVPKGYFTYRHMSDDFDFKFNINTIVEKGIVSTLYPVFTTKNINKEFVLLKLNEGEEFKRYARKQKQGGSRTYMYFSKLSKLRILIPSLQEQIQIVKIINCSSREIKILREKQKVVEEQKRGLMQQLLTGKIRTISH